MVLRRWDPFFEMRRMHEAMDRMRRGGVATAEEPELGTWSVLLDVAEEGDNIVIEASLPGVDPDDIEVTIEDNLLTIKGDTKTERKHQNGKYLIHERRVGTFHRSLRLPNTVDTDKAEPRYEHGVLTVTLPKAESKKAKHLKVAVGKALEGEK